MERMLERSVLPACRELGIGFVAFSPLASGFLSGKVRPEAWYEGDDVRRVITRFTDENVRANRPLITLLETFALESFRCMVTEPMKTLGSCTESGKCGNHPYSKRLSCLESLTGSLR